MRSAAGAGRSVRLARTPNVDVIVKRLAAPCTAYAPPVIHAATRLPRERTMRRTMILMIVMMTRMSHQTIFQLIRPKVLCLCLLRYFVVITELQINVGNIFLILIWIVTLDINTYLHVILTPAELPTSCKLQYP